MNRRTEQSQKIDSTDSDSRAKVFRSEELFDGERKVWIEHAGSQYCLIITRTGKLVLNK